MLPEPQQCITLRLSQRLTILGSQKSIAKLVLAISFPYLESICDKGSLQQLSLHKMKQQPSLKMVIFIVKTWKVVQNLDHCHLRVDKEILEQIPQMGIWHIKEKTE